MKFCYIIFLIIFITFINSCKKEDNPPANYIKYKNELYELSTGIFEKKEKDLSTNIAPLAIHLMHEDQYRPTNEVLFYYYDSIGDYNGNFVYQYNPGDRTFTFLNGGVGLKYDAGGEIIAGTPFRDSQQTTGNLSIKKQENIFTIEMNFQLSESDTNTFEVFYSGELFTVIASQ